MLSTLMNADFLGFGQSFRCSVCRVRSQYKIDQLSTSGLAALVHPPSGKDSILFRRFFSAIIARVHTHALYAPHTPGTKIALGLCIPDFSGNQSIVHSSSTCTK
jgi:hypothetical protein